MLSPSSARTSWPAQQSPPILTPADPTMTAIAAGMSPAEQRRRPAGRFGRNPSPLSFQKSGRDGSGSEHSEDDAQSQSGVDSAGEDGPGVRSPLLPIFSAEHLGMHPLEGPVHFLTKLWCSRLVAGLQYNPPDPGHDLQPMRDHPGVGPATRKSFPHEWLP